MADLQNVFAVLRSFFAKHQDACVVLHDEPGKYYLGSHEVRAKDGYRTWFGGVEIKKSYVSAHVVPVYSDLDLLDGTSDALRKRMHGKSCFNFKTVDDALFGELAALIDAGAERLRATGRL